MFSCIQQETHTVAQTTGSWCGMSHPRLLCDRNLRIGVDDKEASSLVEGHQRNYQINMLIWDQGSKADRPPFSGKLLESRTRTDWPNSKLSKTL